MYQLSLVFGFVVDEGRATGCGRGVCTSLLLSLRASDSGELILGHYLARHTASWSTPPRGSEILRRREPE